MREMLIETTTLSKDWLKETNAIPTEVAICCSKGRLIVTAIYWQGTVGGWDDENALVGCWDDENALAIPNTVICNLVKPG